jgi:ribosomal-protein-alanine N-acetyltransferase
LTIREASFADIDCITDIDTAAFEPFWQYNHHIFEIALRQAATFTVIESEKRILGYQLSTWHIESAHLGRLAIIPEWQGHGLGRMLVEEMLRFFEARGIYRVTVNTQANNYPSQRLYKSLGFKTTGHSVPLWTVEM